MTPDADDLPHLLDDEETSPFCVRDPGEVAQVLRGLVEARSLVAASLVPGGYACPTALLAVHDDGTVLLDGNREEALNARMEAASSIVCKAQLDLVPIRFRLSTPRRMLHEGYVAFSAPWPATLLRLQRREMYRLRCSATATATVHVGDADRSPDPATPGLRVVDVSGGGVALAVPDGALGRFGVGARLAPCLLCLGEAPPLPIALEVAYTARCDINGAPGCRAGCRFVGVPPAVEQQIMQYIFQVERQRNARLRRGG